LVWGFGVLVGLRVWCVSVVWGFGMFLFVLEIWWRLDAPEKGDAREVRQSREALS